MSVWESRNLRASGRGVLIYWHVERKIMAIHSQLIGCSASEFAAMIEQISGDPRQAYVALVNGEQPRDLDAHLRAPRMLGRGIAVAQLARCSAAEYILSRCGSALLSNRAECCLAFPAVQTPRPDCAHPLMAASATALVARGAGIVGVVAVGSESDQAHRRRHRTLGDALSRDGPGRGVGEPVWR
jgi:Tn3 transposase DDE domain-containing protein